MDDVLALAHTSYNPRDVGAAIASGSFPTLGMVVIPCSIKSLSAIANSYSADLLSRAADVTLKEGRPLLLVVRETPLHRGHIRLMDRAAAAGAIIFPPVPAFYTHPQTIDELVDNLVGRMLARLGIENERYQQWEGLEAGRAGRLAAGRPAGAARHDPGDARGGRRAARRAGLFRGGGRAAASISSPTRPASTARTWRRTRAPPRRSTRWWRAGRRSAACSCAARCARWRRARSGSGPGSFTGPSSLSWRSSKMRWPAASCMPSSRTGSAWWITAKGSVIKKSANPQLK